MGRKWSEEKIIEEIKRLHKQGECLIGKYIVQKYPLLIPIAKYYFSGSWKKAVRTAGIEYPLLTQEWTRPKIIEEIKKLHQNGHSLKPEFNKTLFAAACRHFSSYKKAVEATGLSYEALGIRLKKPSKKKVKEQILNLYQKGEPLNAQYMVKYHSRIYTAAKKYWGSYRKAIAAMGLNYRRIMKTRDLKNWIENLKEKEMRRLKKQIFSLYNKKGG